MVAGATGLAGRAISSELKKSKLEVFEVSSKNCDLTNFEQTNKLIRTIKPSVVIDAAAKVGGIIANSKQPVEFLEINSLIQINLFKACHLNSVEKLAFLSSSCVYPKFASQPIKESSLLTGELEATNSAYAIAKISGMKLIQAYREEFGHKWISVMPTNLFGYHDNFSLENSHLLPALIRKFNDAKINQSDSVTLWGTGTPKRELMHANNFAAALKFVIENYDDGEPINIGTGVDHTIAEIAEMVRKVVNYNCEITWDTSKPDGTPRKLLDVTKLRELGFSQKFNLEEDIYKTNQWYMDNFLNNPQNLRL